MKHILFVFCFIACLQIASAQDKVQVIVQGVDQTVASKMKANNDLISWYTMRNSSKLANNIRIEISNVGEKRNDRGSNAVEANPDASGNYSFSVNTEVNLKKSDATKPLHVEVVMETILGNEVYFIGDMSYQDLSKPITLNGYMWRGGNEKIAPERDLCIEFSSYIEDATLRKKFTDNEGFYKFNRNDFTLFLKQDENSAWTPFKDNFEGGFANNNAVSLTNPLPTWIDPSKKLFVRFAAKTPLGNSVWGEYSVEPHEYRKEFRASNYSSVPFDPKSEPIVKAADNSNVDSKQEISEKEKTEPAITEEKAKVDQVSKSVIKTESKTEVKAPVKSQPVQAEAPKTKTGGLKVKINYDELIHDADSLFNALNYSASKLKYEEALKVKPDAEYPKKRAEECALKLKAIQSKKARMGTK